MRVFVGPMEVAGIAAGFAAGLRAHGVVAELVTAYPHPFAYGTPVVDAWAPRAWARVGAWRRRERRLARKAFAVVLQHLLSWVVLAWALQRFDAFVFLYGETVTNTSLEGWILRVAGKRTVVVFVGSDARPAYVDGGWFPVDRPFDPRTALRAAAGQRRRVRRLERQASVTVNARATAQFQTRRFVNWFALGIPRAAHAIPPPPVLRNVLVLHSPSHPALKGTAELRAAVQRLRARGVPVELVTIEGRPNAEVLQALRDCHLVVDQLYSDTPMAAFATEAASLGRAVIVGGCAAERAPSQVGPLPLPPTVYVRPQDIESTLETLVLDAARRDALGAAGARFVADHWSPAAIGSRLLRVLQDDIPAEWWCDPSEVDHVTGCGLPEAIARERVAAVIAAGGPSALQVDDKPALRRAFMDFARAGLAADAGAAP